MINAKNKYEYLSNIALYLLELRVLANKAVDKRDLSPVQEVDEIREKASNIENLPIKKFKLNFSEKGDVRFNNYIQGLYEANNEKVYLWTRKTNVCGLYKVDSIRDVNFLFPFDLNDEGIVVFLSVDMKDKLLLDFYVDSDNNQIIEVESQGLHWSSVKY